MRAWREGRSASQIAAELGGGLTRSAVIGKLHRLGVSGGRKPSAPRVGAAASAPPGAVSKSEPVALRLIWPEPIPPAQPISAASGAPPSTSGAKYLRDMGPRECRFGLGDPGPGQGAFQLFCAAPTTGHAYCAHHRAIAVLPPQSLKEQNVIITDVQASTAAAGVRTVDARRGDAARVEVRTMDRRRQPGGAS
jgi:GcrA cell cycle regulator